MQLLRLCCLLSLVLFARAGATALPEDTGIATVSPPGPHWIWVDDLMLFNDIDGRAFLYDADDGRLLGMLSTGVLFAKLDFPRDYRTIFSAETYFSRGGRGERTDVVTFYDPTTLAPTGEVVIPPRRQTGVPPMALSGLTGDERHLLIYNFNPAQSVSVVDVRERKLASEITTPGCALVFPGGASRFGQLCQDGSWQTIELTADGAEGRRTRSSPFFDPAADPVTEKGVRIGERWIFVSFSGIAHEVDVTRDEPAFAPAWPLLSDADRAESWAVGGAQHLAVHGGNGRLYALVHRGGKDGHKDAGSEVWVYDLARHARVQRLALAHPAISIQVTQDDAPLLIASAGEPRLDVYDASSGQLRRTIEGVGQTPLLIQVIPSNTP
jgi:methylamine dehydrogenase heavy chain